MRVGILSDTHDDLSRTQLAIGLLRDAGADALIHCGDLASPSIVAALAVMPSWFVFGNHDADVVPALRAAATEFGSICLNWAGVIDLDGRRIAVAHGHNSYDIRWALRLRPNYLLSGHSHLASDQYDGVVRRINPGALVDADPLTAALLDLESNDLRFLVVDRR